MSLRVRDSYQLSLLLNSILNFETALGQHRRCAGVSPARLDKFRPTGGEFDIEFCGRVSYLLTAFDGGIRSRSV